MDTRAKTCGPLFWRPYLYTGSILLSKRGVGTFRRLHLFEDLLGLEELSAHVQSLALGDVRPNGYGFWGGHFTAGSVMLLFVKCSSRGFKTHSVH